MPLIEYVHNDGDDYVTERDHRWSNGEFATSRDGPYRHLTITVSDGQLPNDGTDTETVTISIVDGLEVARGTDTANASVLDYSGDVTLRVDGVEMTKTLTNGSVSFDLTTEKPAGSDIEIEAVGLSDHPAQSDSATIEVIQA